MPYRKKKPCSRNTPSHPESDNADDYIQLDEIFNEKTRLYRQGQSHRICMLPRCDSQVSHRSMNPPVRTIGNRRPFASNGDGQDLDTYTEKQGIHRSWGGAQPVRPCLPINYGRDCRNAKKNLICRVLNQYYNKSNREKQPHTNIGCI